MSARSIFTGGLPPSYTLYATPGAADGGRPYTYDDTTKTLLPTANPVAGQRITGQTTTFTVNGVGEPSFAAQNLVFSDVKLADNTHLVTISVAASNTVNTSTNAGANITSDQIPASVPLPALLASEVQTVGSAVLIHGSTYINAAVTVYNDGGTFKLRITDALAGLTSLTGLQIYSFTATWVSDVIP